MARFIHLTDVHVCATGGADGRPAGVERLESVVGIIRAIDPAPDFVVVSGDITDKGDEDSYRIVRKRIEALPFPTVYALGNHDSRPGFYRAMLGRTQDAEAQYCCERTLAGVHVVVLDTSVPGRTSGEVGEAQFAFLDAALGQNPDLPKIVVMHHAPRIDPESPFAWESLSVAETRRFLEVVKGRNIAGILTGHIHHDRFSSWHGIPLVVGTGLQNYIDPLYGEGLRILSGASFSLCTLREWGLTVSVVPLPSNHEHIATIDAATVRTFK